MTEDNLLREIKTDVSEFMQNEIKQKINLHNKEEYQTLVNERKFPHLKKKLKFSKHKFAIKWNYQ